MTPSNDLFDLIKSMSRKEKIHFRVHTKRLSSSDSKKYLNLFDLIAGQSTYQENAIRRQIGMTGKNAQFAVLKNYLYNAIVTHLTNFHTENNEIYQAREYLRTANMLYDKQLIRQSLKYIQKAKVIAEKNHRYYDLMGILFQEELINKNSPDIKQYSETYDMHFKKELGVIEQYLNTRQYIYIDCQLLNAIRTTDNFSHNKSQEKILHILQHPMLRDETQAISLFSQIYFNTINGICYHILADDEKSYNYRKKLVDVMERDLLNTSGYFGNYIGSLHNLTVTEIKLKKFAEAELHLAKLEAFQQEYSKQLSERSKILIKSSHALNTLSLLGYCGDKTTTMSFIATTDTFITRDIKKMDYRYLIHIYYSIAYTAFKFSEYAIAIKYLTKLNVESSSGKLDRYLQRGYRLLLLMVHLEMGNFRLLQYMVINTYRYLLKIGHLTKFDKAIISFIRSNSMDKKALLQFQKQLQAAKADKFEAQEFSHLDVISWVESKLEKKPFIEVYRKNGSGYRP